MTELSDRAISELRTLFQRMAAVERGKIMADARALLARGISNHPPAYLGKFQADVAQGNFGDFEIWTGDKGAEAASGILLPNTYCRTQAMTSTDFGYAYYIDGGYEANKAVC